MPLSLQSRQKSANRGITRRVRHLFHHLDCRGFFLFVEDIHDLPLAATQRPMLACHGRSLRLPEKIVNEKSA
jgi:hypothetical protein